MNNALDLRPRRILVIDDNLAIHEDFAKTLAPQPTSDLADLEAELFAEAPAMRGPTLHFDMSFADQGEAGVRLVAEAIAADAPFSVAFVDMRMPPGLDGIETIKRIWQLDPELQCVICTAYSDYSWEDILSELGVSDRLLLLRKPFDPAEVCQLACALTEKWQLARRAHLKLEQLRAMVDEQTQHLAASEARYALAADGSNDGLWDWNIATGTLFCSARWNAQLGLPSREPALSSIRAWEDRIHPEDLETFRSSFAALESGASDQVSLEYRMRHEDGQYRWVLCRGAMRRGKDGTPVRAAGSQTDITNRKVAETQLRHDALHDALTGLPNRVLLRERIERCLVRQRREPAFRCAVLFIDLDRFKVINDSLGHNVGDALLVAIARRLQSQVRELDTLASTDGRVVRLGGDEFVVLLEGTTHDSDAMRVAERLLTSVAEPFSVVGHTIHASLSIGVALGHPGYERVEDILRDADTALYRAKSDGRGRYSLFTDELHVAAMSRWRTETEIRTGIERREFFLHYQPVVSLSTGEVLHLEALVRWNHPKGVVVGPGDFIPLAEESSLIVPLGQWILSEACRQLRAWADVGVVTAVAVNVAAKQFAQKGFVEEVAALLDEHGVPASALLIEITESAAMGPAAMETCSRLAERGLLLYLDDFGTGYSSLSYLTRMPVKALKIDRSFVSRMLEDPMSESIVASILALAAALGLDTVAEGVESAAEADLLCKMNCRSGQGWYWWKALAPDAVSTLLLGGAGRDPVVRIGCPPENIRRSRDAISAESGR